MAGFEVITYGRFWVITKASGRPGKMRGLEQRTTESGVAQFERALIKERQREGIELAKRKGLYKGRRRSLSPERLAQLQNRVAQGEPKSKLAKEFKISRQTLYSALVRTA